MDTLKYFRGLASKSSESDSELTLFIAVEKEIKQNKIGDFISTFKIYDSVPENAFESFCIDYVNNFRPSNENSAIYIYKLPEKVLPSPDVIEKLEFLQEKTFRFIDRHKIRPLKELSVDDIFDLYIPERHKENLIKFEESVSRLGSQHYQTDETAIKCSIFYIAKYWNCLEVTKQQCKIIDGYCLNETAFSALLHNLQYTAYYRQNTPKEAKQFKAILEEGKMIPVQKLYIIWQLPVIKALIKNLKYHTSSSKKQELEGLVQAQRILETNFLEFNGYSVQKEFEKRENLKLFQEEMNELKTSGKNL